MFYMGPCFLILVVFCSFVVNLGPTAVRLIKTFKTRERLSYIHNSNDETKVISAHRNVLQVKKHAAHSIKMQIFAEI